MLWQDAALGLALTLVPMIIASLVVQKYIMYLAKLGRSRFGLVLLTLPYIVIVGFSLTCLVTWLGVQIFHLEYRAWLYRGGYFGFGAATALAWMRVALRLFRYRASSFIEYTHPRQSYIVGVPLVFVSIFLFAFWRSELIQVGSGWLATRLHNPAFCKLVRDRDRCQEKFYSPAYIQSRVNPAFCRSLSGSHVIKCLIAHHPSQPDVNNCKMIKDREGEDSGLYYWCLSFAPEAHETKEACRRAVSASHWVSAFYGNCMQSVDLNDRIESGKTLLMHYLDFKQSISTAQGRSRLRMKYDLPLTTDFASLLSAKVDIEKSDREGRSLLFYVREPQDLALLLKRGVRLNRQDSGGLSAPMYWMGVENTTKLADKIEMVARAGFDIHVADKKGRDLLSHFLWTLKDRPEQEKANPTNIAIVETILRLGANPYLRDKSKRRAIDYAKDLGLNEIHATLKNYRNYQAGI